MCNSVIIDYLNNTNLKCSFVNIYVQLYILQSTRRKLIPGTGKTTLAHFVLIFPKTVIIKTHILEWIFCSVFFFIWIKHFIEFYIPKIIILI